MAHDRYQLLLSALLDGELSDAERDETMAHLDACDACRAYFAELTALHDAFGELDEIEVPEGFAAGVMARLHEEKPQARKPRSKWRGWMTLAACAAVAILAIQTLPRAGMGSAAPKMAAARSMESAPAYYGASVTADSAPAEAQESVTAAAPEEAPAETEALWETTMLFTSGSTANASESSMDAMLNDSKLALPTEPMEPTAPMAEAALDNGDTEEPLTLTGEGAAQWLAEHAEALGEGRWRVTVEAVNELPDTLMLVGLQEPAEDGTLIITFGTTENPQ